MGLIDNSGDILILRCEECWSHFVYCKKYSYIRRYCDSCVFQKKADGMNKLRKTVKHIRYGKENGNYKGKVKIKCKFCEKDFLVIPALIKTRRFCSRTCTNKWKSEFFSGENNPSYKDGNRCDYEGFTFKLKEEIRERDDRKCQYCNLSERENLEKFGQRLSIHHINDNKNNSDERNLIALCTSCHNKLAPKNEKYFRALFESVIAKHYGEIYEVS